MKTAVSPTFVKQKKDASGNEGRLHRGLIHSGYVEPRVAYAAFDPQLARRKEAEAAAREAEAEARESQG